MSRLSAVEGLSAIMQEDIRQLDFYELRRAGYRGAVFDKDNCLVRSRVPFLCAGSWELTVSVDYSI